MEKTALYGTYDKGTDAFVNYFNAPSDVAAKRFVKGNLKAMELDKKLPDDETLACMSVYKIADVSVSDLEKILDDAPVAVFTELVGKVQE